MIVLFIVYYEKERELLKIFIMVSKYNICIVFFIVVAKCCREFYIFGICFLRFGWYFCKI